MRDGMRRTIKFDSIAARLTWMNLRVTAVALLLACAAFLGYDQITFRESLIRSLSAQAEIAGDNSVSAITFNDPESARRTLGALRNTFSVRAAAIVTPGGQVFAEFERGAGERIREFPPFAQEAFEHSWHSGGNMLIARRIRFDGKEVGTVYILADLQEGSRRLWRYLLIAVTVLVLSLLAALFFSSGFRKSIADPIERLAIIARRVSREKDFGVRAESSVTMRELRVLIAAFNEMLAQIQSRDTALQELAAESQATLQSIPQLVWTANPSGNLEFLNQRWFDYTGMSPEGNRDAWADYLDPEDRAAATAAWQHSVASGEDYRVEFRLRRKDGTYRWHLGQGNPIRDEKGAIQKWFGTATDIHDRKLAEAALVHAEKLAVTGRMAATIAHEINNPLATITNVAHLIGTTGPITGEQRELLAMLSDEVARVSNIVKSTLGLARQSMARSSIDPTELVESVLTLFQRRFEAKNVEVVKRYQAHESVNVVSSELRQVLSNLFSNALDVLPNQGRLTVAVHRSFDWADPERRGVRISISDTGPGVPDEVRHRLFEAFFTTKAEMGTGLGLWVSKNIVEKHGGSIRFRSQSKGRVTGTCFSVFLPIQENVEQSNVA